MALFYGRVVQVVAILILLSGIVLGIVSYRVASNREQLQTLRKFEQFFHRQAGALEREILTCVEALQSLRSFFDSSEIITRREFGRFTGETLSRHPEIQAMEWIPLVKGRERAAHEMMAHAEGFTGYRIMDHGPGGQMLPSPDRSEYYPVFFVEPLIGNEQAIGYDLGSEQTRRAALTRALKSGQVTFTDPVLLVQDQHSSSGILVFLPFFQETTACETPTDKGLKGFILLVFRVEDVVNEAFGEVGHPITMDMHFNLWDLDVRGKPQVIYATGGSQAGAEHHEFSRTLDLGWQQWRLTAWPTGSYLDQGQTTRPLALGGGLFLLWVLAGSLLATHVVRSHKTQLLRRDQILMSVCHNLNEGVVVTDKQSKILLFNSSARRILQLDSKAAEPATHFHDLDVFHPDAESPWTENQLPLVRALSGEVTGEEELLLRHPVTDAEIWLSISGTPVLDEKEQVCGGVLVFRDVTRRKKSRDIVKRLYNAVENTDDTVFITDCKGKIEYVNPAFEKTTGFSLSEALGETPRILKSGHHDEDHYKRLWESILSGKVFREAIVNRKKCGELYDADQTITPMRDTSGRITHFVAVVKDITELRRQQEHEVELQLASKVQQKLFPQQQPDLKGFDIGGALFSADATSGDYYDYISMPGGLLGIIVGDVSGHGLGPSLIMAQTRAYLRSSAQTNSDPGQIINQVNQFLADDLEQHRFVTLFLACIDPSTRSLIYANAGHMPGYILDGAGKTKAVLKSTGLPLGMMPDCSYEASSPVPLEEGDLLVLLTDGVTECAAHEDRFLEDDEILAVIEAHRKEPAQRIVEHIYSKAREFSNGSPQCDDITIVVCKVEGPTPSPHEPYSPQETGIHVRPGCN